MSQKHFAKNGQTFETNIFMGEIVRQIIFPLYKMFGMRNLPISKKDCKIMARMIENYVYMQRKFPTADEWKIFDIRYKYGKTTSGNNVIMSKDFLDSLELYAKFLRSSGGLIDEDKYYKIHFIKHWRKRMIIKKLEG